MLHRPKVGRKQEMFDKRKIVKYLLTKAIDILPKIQVLWVFFQPRTIGNTKTNPNKMLKVSINPHGRVNNKTAPPKGMIRVKRKEII